VQGSSFREYPVCMHTMCSLNIDEASWPPVFNLLIVNSWAFCYSSCCVAVQCVPTGGITSSHVIPGRMAHPTILFICTLRAHWPKPSPVHSHPVWLTNMLPRHIHLFPTEFQCTYFCTQLSPAMSTALSFVFAMGTGSSFRRMKQKDKKPGKNLYQNTNTPDFLTITSAKHPGNRLH
jgi:hypothetical protein